MKNYQLPKVMRSQPAIYCYVFVLGMIVALMVSPSSAESAPQTREVVREVPKVQTIVETPQTCKDALNTDNQIFTKVGAALQTFEFADATAYMNSVLSDRTANYLDCISK